MKWIDPSRLYLAAIFFGVVLSWWSCEASAQTDTYTRAVASFKTKDYRKAADLFTEVEAESAGTTDAMLYKGKCLANLGDFAEAEATLRAYLERHPESPDALAFLGFVLHRENKPQESLEFYNRAAKIEAPHADDLKIVALDYVLLNDLQDAVKWLDPVQFTGIGVHHLHAVGPHPLARLRQRLRPAGMDLDGHHLSVGSHQRGQVSAVRTGTQYPDGNGQPFPREGIDLGIAGARTVAEYDQ